jgi:cysteine synthase B
MPDSTHSQPDTRTTTDLHARVYDGVLDMLPSEQNPTPLVRLNALTPPGSTLYAKLEWMNPFGSVKDRAAWAMIRDLEARGELGDAKPGRGIVEPTSGNTGFSLAAIASVRGYPARAVMPSKVPTEKRALIRMAGADVDISSDAMCPLPGSEDGTIGLARTYSRAQSERYVMPNQYENQINARAHEETTGPEIWRQTQGKVSHVFVSLGTCGTVTGISRYLKSKNTNVKIIAVQPSPGHDVPGLRNVSELDVSKLYDPSLIDEILQIDFNLAYTNALKLLQREGLRAGPSSGLIFEGARIIAARDSVPMGVMIFCDDVFKYVSTMIKHVPELGGSDAEGGS